MAGRLLLRQARKNRLAPSVSWAEACVPILPPVGSAVTVLKKVVEARVEAYRHHTCRGLCMNVMAIPSS